jgi:hypothetical protein
MSLIASDAPSSVARQGPSTRVRDRNIVTTVLAGVARNWLTSPDRPGSHLFADLWMELKCFGAPRVRSVALSRIRGIDRVRVAGPVRRHSPLVVTALASLLQSEVVFEFGPDTGGTAWLLAHNLPGARLFWLDDGVRPADDAPPGQIDRDPRLLPENGLTAEAGPEVSAITRLSGDSASFDFRPYSGTADLVYIEASHRHADMASDTDAAFGLLSELGLIIWDGYSRDPGVYAYLNKLAPKLDRPVFHILGTRLAFYSRWDIVVPGLR